MYIEDLKGKEFPIGLVDTARNEEIDFVERIKLWTVEQRPAGVKVIGTSWVDVNKGDHRKPSVRSRVVAKEIKYRCTVEHYFAAMTPLAAFKG